MEVLLVSALFSWWILFIIDMRAVPWTTLLKTEKVDIEVSVQLFSICECLLWAIAPFKRNYPLYKPLHYLKQSTSIIIKQKKKITNSKIMTAALYTMTWNIPWCFKTRVRFVTLLGKHQQNNQGNTDHGKTPVNRTKLPLIYPKSQCTSGQHFAAKITSGQHSM